MSISTPELSELLSDQEFVDWYVKNAPPEERQRVVVFLKTQEELSRYDFSSKLRDTQKWPDDNCAVEIKLAGRGFGKTLSGAIWLRDQADIPKTRWFVAAPTFTDVRDTIFEGESGIIRVTPPSKVKTYNRSLGEIIFTNGSRIKGFSGDEPDRFRGPQHHGGWWDELAAFRYAKEAWDQAQFGLRLGKFPKQMVTTTPRPTLFMRTLLARPDIHITRGSTFDNAENLAPAAMEELKRSYEGTRLGRQELYAEMLLDTPGAIATYELLDLGRVNPGDIPDMIRKAVWVDPAVTNTSDSDETGITLLGRGVDGDCYFLDDKSCRVDVDEWADIAVVLAINNGVGMIGYEPNQGGDAIGSVLQMACQRHEAYDIVLKPVPASKSKFDRALPLQQWIQQQRFHLAGHFPEFEDQLTSWTIDSPKSPDRLDSGVHNFTELMLTSEKRRPRGVSREEDAA